VTARNPSHCFAARPVQARDKSILHGIGHRRENDWYLLCEIVRHQRCYVAAGRYDYGRPESDHLRCQRSQPRVVIARPTIFDPDVLAFVVAGVPQPCAERDHLLAAALELGDAVVRNPMRGCGGCCAASRIGQAAMVKAMSDSSVNRLIGRLIGRAALYHDPTFPVARFGAGGDDQRLKHCIDPAMEVFHGRIVGQDQIYVVCAIEPILDLPNGFLVRARLFNAKRTTAILRRSFPLRS
jgi:hypothetical protein